MKKLHKALLAGGVTLAVLVPAASAFAAGYGPGNGTGTGNGDRGNGTCTHDQSGDHVQARDGTGWRDTLADGTTVQTPGSPGFQHQSGAMDGTGAADAVRPMDGTGNQWRAGR